jgi:formamidopyrimidine-DNA glycosylase
MPELPEVETIVNDLKKKVLHRTFIALWTDTAKIIKKTSFSQFQKNILGKKIIGIKRRAKNILIYLSDNYVLLIHLKMTGHLLVGKWKIKEKKWVSKIKGAMSNDPGNRFLRLIFSLDNGQQLALSDIRKFAKVELWKESELLKSKEFMALGPEPLDPSFTFSKFKQLFFKKKGKIKPVLMDSKFIAGIGNIYASEILLEAMLHPESRVENLKEKDLKYIYKAIKKVLKKGIKSRGSSISDYRDLQGQKGGFQKIAKIYGKKGQKCPYCNTKIERIVVGQRGTFYCPVCQIKK